MNTDIPLAELLDRFTPRRKPSWLLPPIRFCRRPDDAESQVDHEVALSNRHDAGRNRMIRNCHLDRLGIEWENAYLLGEL